VQRHAQDLVRHDAADAHSPGVFIRDLAGDGELRLHRRFAGGQRHDDVGRMCARGLDGDADRRTDSVTDVRLWQWIGDGDSRAEQ
jgi:hypothetical protein